ncbi:MAG: hypothetical protein K2Y40_10150 [Reyranella sp.]|jgi:hypothetical protein|nr:hypothetical protein [Reyranella sp.]
MKRPSSKSETFEHRQGGTGKGLGGAGTAFDPTDGRNKSGNSRTVERAVPSPGVPVSNEEYEQLKRDAKIGRLPPSPVRQEDLTRHKKD